MGVSKELLSEVLGEDVRIGTYIKADVDEDELVQCPMQIKIYGNKVSYWRYYKEWDDGTTMVSCSVNIYELAHKCKEWALSKGYYISLISDEDDIAKHRYVLNLSWNDGYEVDFIIASEPYNTEVESIIKACEWVLEEINEK